VTSMLVWMDLEMTGLDHTSDVIVEIATIITDDELQIVAEGPDLVIHQPDEVLARMEPFVVEMHTKSGLLEQIKSSQISLADAGEATLAFIREHVPSHRPFRCAATRSAPTVGSWRRIFPTSRTTCTTARSTSRASRNW
jgi:oligoribonuclease (3'-5' exoribonuclease)